MRWSWACRWRWRASPDSCSRCELRSTPPRASTAFSFLSRSASLAGSARSGAPCWPALCSASPSSFRRPDVPRRGRDGFGDDRGQRLAAPLAPGARIDECARQRAGRRGDRRQRLGQSLYCLCDFGGGLWRCGRDQPARRPRGATRKRLLAGVDRHHDLRRRNRRHRHARGTNRRRARLFRDPGGHDRRPGPIGKLVPRRNGRRRDRDNVVRPARLLAAAARPHAGLLARCSTPLSLDGPMSDQENIFSLESRTAIVTGSHRGIGFAVAREMARAGAKVVISSNDESGCEAACLQLRNEGLEAAPIPCDVGADPDLAALVDGTLTRFCRLDILVCNAGVNPNAGPMATASDEQYDQILRINLRAAFKLCNLAIPHMAAHRDGVVILTGSISGVRGNKTIGIYGLSKAALAQLARNLVVEWGPSNIRVNAISPGLIRTEFATPSRPAALSTRTSRSCGTRCQQTF